MKRYFDVQKAYDNGETYLLMGGMINEDGLFREKDILEGDFTTPLLVGKNEIKDMKYINGYPMLEFEEGITLILSEDEYKAGLVEEK